MDLTRAIIIVGRPLTAFALFFAAALLARAITRRMRDSPFKRALTTRLSDTWLGAAACFGATLILWGAIFLATRH
jgi:hypothetical protein